MSANWTVTVGNVGTVYAGSDEGFARTDYWSWVAVSNTGVGRAAGEDVTLFKDGVIVLEHSATPNNECSHCGAMVASIIGCPDGQELCQACFDAGHDDPAGNPCDTCGGHHPLVILSANTGNQRCPEHHVDAPDDLTDSLSFTRRQQDILGAALNQIAAMGLFPAAEVEELAEMIAAT